MYISLLLFYIFRPTTKHEFVQVSLLINLYTHGDDSEHPMDYETSLLLKFFLYIYVKEI